MKFAPFGQTANFSHRFVIYSHDEKTLDTFTLLGTSCIPQFEVVSISEHNLNELPEGDFHPDYILHDLMFEDLNPSTTQTKKGTSSTFMGI